MLRLPSTSPLAPLALGAHVEDDRRIGPRELLGERGGGDPLGPLDQVRAALASACMPPSR